MYSCVSCNVELSEESPRASLLTGQRRVILCYDCWVQYELDRKHQQEAHNAFPDYPLRDPD